MQELEEQSHQKLNIRKVKYFLQKNDQEKPNLPSQIGIMQLLRQYLNDDDFHIFYRDESIFSIEGYEQKLQQLYRDWNQHVNGELNIDEFIIHWVKKDKQLDVRYTLYQEMTEEQRLYQVSHVLTQKDQNQKTKKEVSAYNKKDRIKLPTSQSSISNLNKQSLQPLDYLNKFFSIYSKQAISVSNATFNQYQKHYNSINLIKWMHFIRDIGISAYNKAMNPKKMKEVFMKFQNNDKVLIFETFQAAVNELMILLFGQDKQRIVNEGYQLLGIKDQQSFQQKFKQMGMLVPIFTRVNLDTRASHVDIIASKVSLMKNVSNKLKVNKSVQIQKQTKFSNLTLVSSSSSKNLPKINFHPKIVTSQKQRTHIFLGDQDKNTHLHLASQLQQSRLTKVTARHHRPHYNLTLMDEIMKQQQDDPYLKRYNNKQNYKYHCIANRIDERIQKIINKYDQ